MSADQQLRDAAKALVAAAERGQSVLPLLKKICPNVCRQIVRDGKTPGLLSLWGRCLNVDENVGQVIVHPAILEAIGALAGLPMRGRIVHAGLQHTYGYLFSLLETPYGSKRDRWVSTEPERGFGIDRSLLSDRPKDGTLLANSTWFLGRIVYRDRPRSVRQLEQIAGAVAQELIAYDFGRLPVCRLEEVVSGGRTGREIVLVTDLVAYPNPPADPEADSTLLIYAVRNGCRAPLKLITAFPVRTQAAQDLKASVSQRGPADVRVRYNAYIPGLAGKTLPGRRCMAKRPAQN
jgi:hypothetical protein